MIAPKPELVLPAVEIELKRLKAKPSAQRRKRQRNEAEHAAIEAIRGAYQEQHQQQRWSRHSERSTYWSTAQPWP